jgi:omega-6 fatty acid desaturase (delta-12 desaturase)
MTIAIDPIEPSSVHPARPSAPPTTGAGAAQGAQSPAEVYAYLKAHSISLADLRAALPPQTFALSVFRQWRAVFASFALVALGEALLAQVRVGASLQLLWQLPALALGWLIVATGMVRLFVIGHDCGHRAFSRKVWVNDLVGHLCMGPIWSSFHGWRIGHNFHHTKTLVRGVDVDWAEGLLTREEYEKASPRQRLVIRTLIGSPLWALLGGFLLGLFRRTFMELYPQIPQTAANKRQLWVSRLAIAVMSGGIATALGILGGAAALFKYYVVPLELGMMAGALVTYCHHNSEGSLAYDHEAWDPLLGQVSSTFDVRWPSWLGRLFLNTNYHRVHHIAPKVPYYHMREATVALNRAYPAIHLERQFSLGYLRRSFRRPLLEAIGEGVYSQTGELPSPHAR